MENNKYVTEKERLYQEGVNNQGDLMQIVSYNGYDDVIVRFLDGSNYEVHTQYSNFVQGKVRNAMHATHGLHGYVGSGKYQSEYKIDGKRVKEPAYEVWRKIHLRAGNYAGTHPAYEDVTVSKEWWCFQDFAEWFHENLYKVDDEVMCVDKDILIPGNRVYGPDYCLIVPNRINEIFKNGDKKNNATELPTGVTIRKDGSKVKYRARCSVRVAMGEYKSISKTFDTPEEAYEFYKKSKLDYIKSVAEEYKNKIPNKVYRALCEYEFPEE